MKCTKCNTENEANAKFCRSCGAPMDEVPVTNIMDKYDKYGFIPTNLIDWKKPIVSRLLFSISSLAFFVFLSLSLYFYCSSKWYFVLEVAEVQDYEYNDNDEKIPFTEYNSDIHDYLHLVSLGDYSRDRNVSIENAKEYFSRRCNELILIFGIFSVPAFILCFITYRPYPSKSTKKLTQVADYIQKYTYTGIFSRRNKPMYRFYIKSKKFGVVDVAHYKVHINAIYDYLEWREKNKYLNAILNGRKFIIDINGKELN